MPIGNVFGVTKAPAAPVAAPAASVSGSMAANYGPAGAGMPGRATLLAPTNAMGLSFWIGILGIAFVTYLYWVLPA